jgi:hypothetical protein
MAGNDDKLTADGLLAHYKSVRKRLGVIERTAPVVRVQRPPTAPARPPATQATQATTPAPGKGKPPDSTPHGVTLRADKPTPPKNYNAPNWRGARKIIVPVLAELCLTWREIIEDDRHRPYVLARRQVYHALREAGWSYPAIGALCLRDHASVIYAVKMWRAHLADPTTKPDPQSVKKRKDKTNAND